MNSTGRFSDRAKAYSAHRPGYPAEVFESLFDGLGDPRALVVADIGAGTGISTQLLADRVARVVAIEPNERMREQAVPRSTVVWLGATGERTGLDDKSVDVAAAFQAFHWLDPQAGFDEFSRIARRRIALVQYERDETQAFSAAYAQLIRPYMLDETESLRLRTVDNFAQLAGEGLRRAIFPFSHVLTLEGLLGRAASASYLPQVGERAEMLQSEIRELFARFAHDGTVKMAMSVYVLAANVPR